MELTLSNPIFAAYVIAAALMVLKVVGMSWLTVYRMMKVKGGYRSPEDLRKTPLNPTPSAKQLAPNDYVDRIRRIQLNDLENVPFFLVIGFLFLFAGPSLLEARILFYGYAGLRILHFFAYVTEQTHDLRAALWTPGSLMIIYMSVRSILAAVS